MHNHAGVSQLPVSKILVTCDSIGLALTARVVSMYQQSSDNHAWFMMANDPGVGGFGGCDRGYDDLERSTKH